MPVPEDREEIEIKLIARLKLAREAQELSQTKLAKLAGVSRSTITHLEDGSARPTLWVLIRVTNALQLELWQELRAASNRE